MVENEFQEICENIKFAKNIEDFYLFQISTTIFFSDSKIHLNTKKQNVLTPLENIFLNENFILILEKVLDQYVAFKKNYDASSQAPFFEEFKGVEIKNKKIIFSALIASLLPLAAVIDQMTEEEVISYSESFYSILSRLKRVFANKYSLSDINVVLSCVFYKDFYPKNVPIPKEYLTFDREYLYKYQNLMIISLILK